MVLKSWRQAAPAKAEPTIEYPKWFTDSWAGRALESSQQVTNPNRSVPERISRAVLGPIVPAIVDEAGYQLQRNEERNKTRQANTPPTDPVAMDNAIAWAQARNISIDDKSSTDIARMYAADRLSRQPAQLTGGPYGHLQGEQEKIYRNPQQAEALQDIVNMSDEDLSRAIQEEQTKRQIHAGATPAPTYGEAEGVRQLTMDEWNELSPIQQRAVQGNYALYEAREDPERQAELFSILNMDPSEWAGDGSIGGYASYEDILAMDEYIETEQNRPGPVAPQPIENLDSLVALANSVYRTSSEAEPDIMSALLGTPPDKKPILDEGLGDFSTLSLAQGESAWISENLIPRIADDEFMDVAVYDQEALDSLYADIQAAMPTVSRARIVNYLLDEGNRQGVEGMEERLAALGFFGRE